MAALEESLDRERQFVNDASHELRTPLTLLKSRIQLTRRRRRTVEEHEQVLDELAVDVTRLADLAEQLLALSQDPTRAPAVSDAAEHAARVVERWRAAHPDRAGDLVLEVPADPACASIEPHALERIAMNLVTNALTHGEPPVRLAVHRGAGHVAMEVSDAGAGMSPDLLAQATRRFNRAPEARSRPGAGLGLSIVQELVRSAGGELRLCFGGHHHSTGDPTAVECRHDDRMTVTVILPSATG